MADEAIVNKKCNILKANGIANNIVDAIRNEVTLSMICRGEVTDDDLKRLGANTIGDRLNIKRIKDVVQEELRRVFFSPTQSSTSTPSSVTSARNILASLQSSQSTVNPNMHSSTNVASVQPQFNAQTDKLNRKRAGSKRSLA